MSLGGRFRRFTGRAGEVLSGRRPGVELVRVGPAELPPSAASSRPPRALPAPPGPRLHPCPYCGQQHQPVPMGGGGMAAAYGQQLLPDPGASRPAPLGRQPGETGALLRDLNNAWRASPAAVPPPPAATLRERLAGWWQG